MFKLDIIDRINLKLAENGKTGADLSRELGLSNSSYSQWNTRKTKPSKRTLPLIAQYLGTTTEYLLGVEQEKAPTQEGKRSKKLRSISRLEDADITEDEDAQINELIEWYFKTKGKDV